MHPLGASRWSAQASDSAWPVGVEVPPESGEFGFGLGEIDRATAGRVAALSRAEAPLRHQTHIEPRGRGAAPKVYGATSADRNAESADHRALKRGMPGAQNRRAAVRRPSRSNSSHTN